MELFLILLTLWAFNMLPAMSRMGLPVWMLLFGLGKVVMPLVPALRRLTASPEER